MDQQKLTSDFIENLQGLNSFLDKLSKLLIEEENALAEQNIADIETIAVEKDQLTAQVEQSEQVRQAHCVELNISPDKKGILHWLADKPASTKKQIAELWKRITYLGQKCSNQNQINGILVSHLHRHTQEALSILRGAVAGQESYSDKGAPENKARQNIIAKV